MAHEISFGLRAHGFTEQEEEVVLELLRGQQPLTQHTHLKQFEQDFGTFVGVDHCFATTSATTALELVASVCQIEKGDEVVVPAHTYTSSVYPFVKAGATIVWADIDSDTRVVTAEKIETCLSGRTRLIVVPHLYGFGAGMSEIMTLATAHGVLVVEDAAQAIGVRIDGQMAGSFADFAVFSFHSHKNITTLGEGGMLVVRDPQVADLIPAVRHNGHYPYPENRQDYWIPAMTDVVLPRLNGRPIWPMNCCLGEIACAVGSALLLRVDSLNSLKRERALRVIDALSDCPALVFHRETSERHNYHLLVARVKGGLRDAFIRRMYEGYGIQCVVQYYPLNRYPFFRDLGFGVGSIPETDRFFDSMVSFPFSSLLSDQQIDDMVSVTRQVLTGLSD